jgi:hypothetical protein
MIFFKAFFLVYLCKDTRNSISSLHVPAKDLEREIFSIQNSAEFDSTALIVFKYQYEHCEVYQKYVNLLGKEVKSVSDIPFLPIDFFKYSSIISGSGNPEILFESSGTTGSAVSKHHLLSSGIYKQSFRRCFELFYGPPKSYRILALLPSYLERGNSSLVYMVHDLIGQTSDPESGFYLNNFDELKVMLEKPSDKKTLLIGVSFGLLDFLERYQLKLQNTIVMETGGMKGRRKEMIRLELHEKLKAGFGVYDIHSEYGMTELLSQAYSTGEGIFKTPPWMRIQIREANDPLSPAAIGKTGGVNITDLANLYSCSFIASSDLGREIPGKGVEILGRFDYSDIRGCNLMVAN